MHKELNLKLKKKKILIKKIITIDKLEDETLISVLRRLLGGLALISSE